MELHSFSVIFASFLGKYTSIFLMAIIVYFLLNFISKKFFHVNRILLFASSFVLIFLLVNIGEFRKDSLRLSRAQEQFEKALVEKDMTQAAFFALNAAENGYGPAQNLVGTFYENGQGLPKDMEKAVFWYQKAFAQNNMEAAYNLGRAYAEGRYVRQDYDKAVKLLAIASQANISQAHFYLGSMYESGTGVTRNELQSGILYEKAAVHLPIAQLIISHKYRSGTGVEKNVKKSNEWLVLAAKNGLADAQYDVGMLHLLGGEGIKIETKESFNWFLKAAQQGHLKALTQVAKAYFTGQGVEQNYQQAQLWYSIAAEQGVSDAQLALGDIYYRGIGLERDTNKAFLFFKVAAENGNPEAQGKLARAYRNGYGTNINKEEALRWFHEGAKQNDARSMAGLGTMYKGVQGQQEFRKTDQEGCLWFKKAADLGTFPSAFADLGLCYLDDKGFEIDAEKAFYWIKKSADQNNPWGMLQLAKLYWEGKGTDQDRKLARELLIQAEKAAYEQEDFGTLNDIAAIYSEQNYGILDYKKSFALFKAAADFDLAIANANVGLHYTNGWWVEKNDSISVSWYRKSAERGSAFGQEKLAFMYASGRGVERDLEKAYFWYNKAAEQGDSTAQFSLGYMYAFGYGIAKDEVKAIYWLKKSAAQGNDTAQRTLKNLGMR